ncbi:hypothetical protein L228DRAFT_207495, partial [Xylona heveae TC161]
LKKIPHFYLGWVEGAWDIAIYVLFPHLPFDSAQFTCLTQAQSLSWLDKIFYLAVYCYCWADYMQHLPVSYCHVLYSMQATASYQACQQLSYYLQPEYLADIWCDILDTMASTLGLCHFCDP